MAVASPVGLGDLADQRFADRPVTPANVLGPESARPRS